MRKILIPLALLLLQILAFADSQRVNVIAWGVTASGNENKFLEDEGLQSGIGIADLWLRGRNFTLAGFYLPNQNADLKFTFSVKDKWRLAAGFKQFRKWWNSSTGHETTPGGYAVSEWLPGTNSIAPLSDQDHLRTTRRSGFAVCEFLVTPLQKVSLGYERLARKGDQSPLFRGFTFVGDVPFAATAASIRNIEENGHKAVLKGNFIFRQWSFDVKASVLSLDNSYGNTIGTFGITEQVGLTNMEDNYSTNVFQTLARLGYSFRQGEIFGAFVYSKLDSDPANSLVETGTFFSGMRSGSGTALQEATRFQLGFSWKPARGILFHAAGIRMDRSKEGNYSETRTDFPAGLDTIANRDLTRNQLRTRVRFLFRKLRVDLYTQYTSREVDEQFTSVVAESRFDRSLFRDLTRTHDEWRGGVRASLGIKNMARLRLKLEAYKQKQETELRDLTWGYYPGDADTDGMDGSYRLSLSRGRWQFFVQGSIQAWNRDQAAPYFDPIYDPTQLFEEASSKGLVQQHILTTSAQIKGMIWNVRVGYIGEKFSFQDTFSEFNYQPVEYNLRGILYGLGGALSGRTWSLDWDASYIDTSGSQSHDRIRGSVDFSKQIHDGHALVVNYRYFNFDEAKFELDDFQGHFFAIGWRYKF